MKKRDLLDVVFHNFERNFKALLEQISKDESLAKLSNHAEVFFEETKKTLAEVLSEFDKLARTNAYVGDEEPLMNLDNKDVALSILLELLRNSQIDELMMIRVIRAIVNCSVNDAITILASKQS
jgi:hypothetical protein